MSKEKVLFIFSRFHANPKNIYHKCGTGVAQLEILGVLEQLGYDVYFAGQEDSTYPKEYIQESRAIIYIAPALPKFIRYKPKAKLILFANNSHVLVRNARMRASAAKWGVSVESLGPEQTFLQAYKASDYVMVAANASCIKTFTDNGVPLEKIARWHNSIDTTLYKPASEKFPEFTFMYWSSEVGLRKGLPVLLAAWKKWNNPHARLMLMGMVTKVGKQLLFKRTWYGKRIARELPGVRLELSDYASPKARPSGDPFFKEMMGKSHVGVFPTLEDNQPACVMEMAATGLPMILTEESGFELDPSWSWKVKMDDVDSLVQALDESYQNKMLARKGAAARQHMIDHHSWEDFRLQFSNFLKTSI